MMKMCKRLTCFCIVSMQLKDLKQELAALRVAKVTGGAPNKLSKMYVLFEPKTQ